MIPLKLQLKNFLSYGAESQTVDFTPFNLICLSGKNGHGKSALLDAICWAIWGEARKVSVAAKPDQGLLRLGQRNMKVVFDFEFNQQQYRIRREFTFAYNKPYALLEFGTVNPTTGEFVALTDKTIKTTQTKITTTLGLSYAAFVNSAFLRQGQSHEFSKKSPSERKQVLGEMLGLDQYEQLRKLALEKIKNAEADKQVGLKLQQHWAAELQQLTVVEATVQQTRGELTTLDAELQAALTAKTQLDQDLNQRQNLALQHSQQLQQLHELRQQWRATQRLHLQLQQSGVALDQLQHQQQALTRQAQQLQAQRQQALTLQAEFLALQLEQQTNCAAQQLQISQLTQQLNYQKQQLAQLASTEQELSQSLAQQQ
ncbi:MAG TPA: AAA family ATPase, partial [Candidatus Babeliales bacterium]|nr:AAA family ATPase [Candidatus Babeliales bacterium]